jgi:hypothetical protein
LQQRLGVDGRHDDARVNLRPSLVVIMLPYIEHNLIGIEANLKVVGVSRLKWSSFGVQRSGHKRLE